MIKLSKRHFTIITTTVASMLILVSYQNCGQVKFAEQMPNINSESTGPLCRTQSFQYSYSAVAGAATGMNTAVTLTVDVQQKMLSLTEANPTLNISLPLTDNQISQINNLLGKIQTDYVQPHVCMEYMTTFGRGDLYCPSDDLTQCDPNLSSTPAGTSIPLDSGTRCGGVDEYTNSSNFGIYCWLYQNISASVGSDQLAKVQAALALLDITANSCTDQSSVSKNEQPHENIAHHGGNGGKIKR